MNNKRIDYREQDDPFGPFNLSDFKKWMKCQPDESEDRPEMVGVSVESKLPIRKLVSRMEIQDGELLEVAREFKRSGGDVTDEEGNNLLIEVDSGTFVIHRMFVKRKP